MTDLDKTNAQKQEIFEKAKKLGQMIQETDIYMQYQKLKKDIDSDKEAMSLLNEYNNYAGNLHNKNSNGDIIEQYELEEFKTIIDQVSSNELLMSYINSLKEYENLLLTIQKMLQLEKAEEE